MKISSRNLLGVISWWWQFDYALVNKIMLGSNR